MTAKRRLSWLLLSVCLGAFAFGCATNVPVPEQVRTKPEPVATTLDVELISYRSCLCRCLCSVFEFRRLDTKETFGMKLRHDRNSFANTFTEKNPKFMETYGSEWDEFTKKNRGKWAPYSKPVVPPQRFRIKIFRYDIVNWKKIEPEN